MWILRPPVLLCPNIATEKFPLYFDGILYRKSLQKKFSSISSFRDNRLSEGHTLGIIDFAASNF